MKALITALLLTLVSLVAADSNMTIRYFSTKEGCVDNYFQCSNIPIGYCCQASAPWCVYVQCPDCTANYVWTYSLVTHDNGKCSGDPIQPTCVSSSPLSDSCCTVDWKGKTDICSTMISTDVGSKREEGDGCLGVVQPDAFVYTDAGGATRQVHLPNGTFSQAVGFASVGDWNGLDNFLDQATT